MGFLTKLVIFCTCILMVKAFDTIPSWKLLQEKLHEKIEGIFSSERHLKIQSGKYFKFDLPYNGQLYEVFDAKTKSLPKWLSFDPMKNELHGVPSDADLGKIKLQYHPINENSHQGFADGSQNLYLHIKPFHCKHDAVTIAHVIFHINLKKFDGNARVELIRNFSFQMGLSMNDVHLFDGNKMESDDFNPSIIHKAGPGDHVTGEQPGITVSWKIKDIIGNKQISQLTDLSQKEDFVSVFKQPVLGWFVTTTNSRERRAIGMGGTVFVSGTPSIAGTPTLVSSKSVSVVATDAIKPTSTKSIVMKMTSMPATLPPVTPTTDDTSKSTTSSTEETTKTKQSTTKSSSTKDVQTTQPTSGKPKLVNGIDKIDIIAGQALRYELPVQMFFHPNDHDLEITFRYYPNNTEVPPNYWIVYKDKVLYILPPSNTFGSHRFILTATDPSGAFISDVFEVRVAKDPVIYNLVFNVTLDLDFNEYNSVQRRVVLVQKLAKAMSTNILFDYQHLRSLKFLPGSIIVQWGVNGLNSYNDVEVQRYIQMLQSAEFKTRLGPVIVEDVGHMCRGDCSDVVGRSDDDDGGLWQRILIPVIVIIIILIIIALILCCVYRRKRTKYEPASEQDSDYFGRKKPVIFLEEFEEKEDFVSLQPLILPNEKPPTQQAYEPRADTPEGPSSSTTGSSENEEKELLGSPKDSQRKGFNAPPPYSAH